jgi:hypothetical protein
MPCWQLSVRDLARCPPNSLGRASFDFYERLRRSSVMLKSKAGLTGF